MAGKFFIPLLSSLFSIASCGQAVNNTDAQVPQVVSMLPVVDTLPKKVRNYTRFEREIIRFEESDKLSMPAAGSILFVGSSSIRLWKTLPQDMAPLPVVNRGFGGATIGEVNYYFHRIVDKYKPRFIVFYAGENDLFSSEFSVDSVVNDFNRFRDNVKKHLPQCQAFFISVKPSPARWLFQDKFLEANNRFRAICDMDARWTYVDVVPRMLDPTGKPRKEIFRSDSLHMNTYGYTDWTHILSPYLHKAWKAAEQADKAKR